MIDSLHPGLAALAGGILGALLGGLGVRRSQRSLRAELDLLARQQAQRDAAARRREDERSVALHALISLLAAPAAPAGAPAAAIAPVVARRAAARTPAPSAVPVRPPGVSPAPLPWPGPLDDAPEPLRELSDDEIDALPPDLPVADRARRGPLPAPKRPTLHHL